MLTKVKFKFFRKELISKKYLNWLNDKESSRYLTDNNKKNTINDIRNYVNYLDSSKLDYFFSIHKLNNEHIGNLRLGPIDNKKKIIRFGIMIGSKKNWGKGIGSQAMKFAINFSFQKKGFKKIILSVSDKNIPAIRLYQKYKFKIDRRYKKIKVGNLNLITMILKNNYL